MRTLLVAVALTVTVAPAAQAKKHHSLLLPHKKAPVATRRAPARVVSVAPAKMAAAAPMAAAPVAAAPTAAAPVAAAPVARGPAVDQAADDEVPGSRTKKR